MLYLCSFAIIIIMNKGFGTEYIVKKNKRGIYYENTKEHFNSIFIKPVIFYF